MEQACATAGQSGDENRALDPFEKDVRLALLLRLEARQIRKTAKRIPTGGVAAEDIEVRFPFVTLEQQPQRGNKRAVAEFRAPGSPQGLRHQCVCIEARSAEPQRGGHVVKYLEESLWGRCWHSAGSMRRRAGRPDTIHKELRYNTPLVACTSELTFAK